MALRWLFAYALTQTIEVGVYYRAFGEERSRAERLAIAFAASGITHPIVTYVIPELVYTYVSEDFWVMVAFAEPFAVLAEAAFLACFGLRWWALAWAMAANGSSFLAGLFIYYYTPPT